VRACARWRHRAVPALVGTQLGAEGGRTLAEAWRNGMRFTQDRHLLSNSKKHQRSFWRTKNSNLSFHMLANKQVCRSGNTNLRPGILFYGHINN
jgi:hypothetical protein